MENEQSPKGYNDVKAKMPTPEQTEQSMKGKTNEHDEDRLHDSHTPLDVETDPAVNIVKTDDM